MSRHHSEFKAAPSQPGMTQEQFYSGLQELSRRYARGPHPLFSQSDYEFLWKKCSPSSPPSAILSWVEKVAFHVQRKCREQNWAWLDSAAGSIIGWQMNPERADALLENSPVGSCVLFPCDQVPFSQELEEGNLAIAVRLPDGARASEVRVLCTKLPVTDEGVILLTDTGDRSFLTLEQLLVCYTSVTSLTLFHDGKPVPQPIDVNGPRGEYLTPSTPASGTGDATPQATQVISSGMNKEEVDAQLAQSGYANGASVLYAQAGYIFLAIKGEEEPCRIRQLENWEFRLPVGENEFRDFATLEALLQSHTLVKRLYVFDKANLIREVDIESQRPQLLNLQHLLQQGA